MRTPEEHRAYWKTWKANNPEKIKAAEKRVRERRKADPERTARYREYQRNYQKMLRVRDKEKHRDRRRALYQENREQIRQSYKEKTRRLKQEVFAHYGGCCTCCGENNLVFLTLDHIHGDGAEHRRKYQGSRGAGTSFYQWVKSHGYPDTVQILCYNCNCAKRTDEVCPHQLERLESSMILGEGRGGQ